VRYGSEFESSVWLIRPARPLTYLLATLWSTGFFGIHDEVQARTISGEGGSRNRQPSVVEDRHDQYLADQFMTVYKAIKYFTPEEVSELISSLQITFDLRPKSKSRPVWDCDKLSGQNGEKIVVADEQRQVLFAVTDFVVADAQLTRITNANQETVTDSCNLAISNITLRISQTCEGYPAVTFEEPVQAYTHPPKC